MEIDRVVWGERALRFLAGAGRRVALGLGAKTPLCGLWEMSGASRGRGGRAGHLACAWNMSSQHVYAHRPPSPCFSAYTPMPPGRFPPSVRPVARSLVRPVAWQARVVPCRAVSPVWLAGVRGGGQAGRRRASKACARPVPRPDSSIRMRAGKRQQGRQESRAARLSSRAVVAAGRQTRNKGPSPQSRAGQGRRKVGRVLIEAGCSAAGERLSLVLVRGRRIGGRVRVGLPLLLLLLLSKALLDSSEAVV